MVPSGNFDYLWTSVGRIGGLVEEVEFNGGEVKLLMGEGEFKTKRC